MASVKTFSCPSASSHYYNMMSAKSYIKLHSLPDTSERNMNRPKYFGGKTSSSPIDAKHARLTHVNMLPLLTSTMTANSHLDLCRPIHHLNKSIDASMPTVKKTYADGNKKMASVNSSCSPVAADFSIPLQPNNFSTDAVPYEPLRHSVLTDSNIPISSFKSSYKMPTKEKMKENTNNTQAVDPVISSYEEKNVASDCSDFNVTEMSKESIKKNSLGYEGASFDSENSFSSGDIRNQSTEIESIVNENISQCTFRSKNNLAAVLLAPRRKIKKGRPSSKKQKKRQREKHKQKCSSLQVEKTLNTSQTKHEMKQKMCYPTDLAFASSPTKELYDALNSPSTSSLQFKNTKKNECTLVKCSSNFYGITSTFFRQLSSSEEIDGSSDWSENEYCTSPIKDCGFDFTSTPDFTFKRKSTSIFKNAEHAEANGTNLTPSMQHVKNNLCQNLSVEDSASPVSSEHIAFNFTPRLSLDTLFPKKQNVKNQNAANLTDIAVPFVNDCPSASSSSILTSGKETDFETLNKINQQWNDNYPTVGFRNCNSTSDYIEHPSIKVHFAAEPDFVAVYIVEAEECVDSSHYILDRERFKRRILESEQIISPVLNADHRAKFIQRRQCLEKQ